VFALGAKGVGVCGWRCVECVCGGWRELWCVGFLIDGGVWLRRFFFLGRISQ